jgi:signal transduction histidine kinase/CheY-like chemotaxis protein
MKFLSFANKKSPPFVDLNHRLRRIIQLSLSIAILIIILAVEISSFVQSLQILRGENQSKAKVLAENSSAALMFNDRAAAQELLNALRFSPEVGAAAIVDTDQNIFVSYALTGRSIPNSKHILKEAVNYDWNQIQIATPILQSDELQGILLLHVELTSIYQRMLLQFIVMMVATLLALLIIRYLLQRLILSLLQPITSMTAMMDDVSERSDYSLRAKESRVTEINRLAQGFNSMLEQVQERDRQLEASRDQLEEKVAKRTEDLLLAKQVAEEASLAKSEFLAAMSHEIRTPMNGVLGMTELLLQNILDAKLRYFAESAQQSGQHLMAIINDILDFSKIESGHMQMEHVPFNLNLLLEEVLQSFTQSAEKKQIELISALPAARYWVVGDALRLRQVLFNLLSNALKFTQSGSVILRLEIGQVSEHVIDFCVSVEDTGIGISPEKHRKIFEHFSQADGSTTRQFGGTGLGLAICRSLIMLMGGEIFVDSDLGKGARFSIKLSLEKVMPANDDETTLSTLNLSGKTVLLVDDHNSNLMVLQGYLKNVGMKVICAGCASAALEHIEHLQSIDERLDFAVIDKHMPGLDGMQLARLIHAQEHTKQTKMILLIQSTDIYDVSDTVCSELILQQIGILRCINKPIRQISLLTALSQMIAESLTITNAVSDSSNLANLARVIASESTHPLKGACVLVVEDNPVNTAVAELMLEKMEIKTILAENGQEALDIVQQRDLDLILMDCQMPVMDGFFATRAIRELPLSKQSKLPIIALTANAQSSDQEKCRAAGMDDYLSKPYTYQQLEQKLFQWLKHFASPEALGHTEETRVAAIDLEFLEQYRRLDKTGSNGLIRLVMSAFLSSAKHHIPKLEQAILEEDDENVRKTAHFLKSGAANVGAKHFAQCLSELEQIARQQDMNSAKTKWTQIKREYDRVVAQLLGYLESDE